MASMTLSALPCLLLIQVIHVKNIPTTNIDSAMQLRNASKGEISETVVRLSLNVLYVASQYYRFQDQATRL